MTPPKIYGLIGYPVKHSLSPAMHNAAFKALGIPAEYRLFPIKPQDLSDFFGSLAAQNIYGLNVTIPYKEKVVSFLDKFSHEAKLIGAVNTIKRQKDKLFGFNTDAEGFLRHLKGDLKFNPKAKSIAILGAGGASRAISVSLSKLRPKRIAIYDIDLSKGVSLINYLKSNFKYTEFVLANSIQDLDILKADMLINATGQGMKDSDPLPVEPQLLHKNLLVYDLIYNPKETRLLKVAREKGAKVANGLYMLLYQGTRSFEVWTAKKAPEKIMKKALLGAL